ncbi:unnamed protein product, partial [Phaeothamnion confervicola]
RVGFKPSVWGTCVWSTIHMSTLSLPRDPTQCEKRAMVEFFTSMMHVLPCKACRVCYSQLITVVPSKPFVDKGRAGAFAYGWLLHNLVNKKTGVSLVGFLEAAE